MRNSILLLTVIILMSAEPTLAYGWESLEDNGKGGSLWPLIIFNVIFFSAVAFYVHKQDS